MARLLPRLIIDRPRRRRARRCDFWIPRVVEVPQAGRRSRRTHAQRALDELGNHYNNMTFCIESLKTARRPSDKARIKAIMKSSERMVSKLREVAARHERLARSYGYKAPFNRPESDSNP